MPISESETILFLKSKSLFARLKGSQQGRHVTFVGAGHPPAVLVSNGTPRLINSQNGILGCLSEIAPSESVNEIELANADILQDRSQPISQVFFPDVWKVALSSKLRATVNTPFDQGVPTKPEEAQRLSQAMQRFYAAMARNYRLEVELPTSLDKPTSWELRFSEEGKSRWKNARVNYPTQLAACSRCPLSPPDFLSPTSS